MQKITYICVIVFTLLLHKNSLGAEEGREGKEDAGATMRTPVSKSSEAMQKWIARSASPIRSADRASSRESVASPARAISESSSDGGALEALRSPDARPSTRRRGRQRSTDFDAMSGVSGFSALSLRTAAISSAEVRERYNELRLGRRAVYLALRALGKDKDVQRHLAARASDVKKPGEADLTQAQLFRRVPLEESLLRLLIETSFEVTDDLAAERKEKEEILAQAKESITKLRARFGRERERALKAETEAEKAREEYRELDSKVEVVAAQRRAARRADARGGASVLRSPDGAAVFRSPPPDTKGGRPASRPRTERVKARFRVLEGAGRENSSAARKVHYRADDRSRARVEE
jgi:hypothetical protein